MKKIILFLLSIALTGTLLAEPIGIKIKNLNLQLPMQDVAVVYLYDFVGEQSMVGVETVISTYGEFKLTLGAVTETGTDTNDYKSRRGLPFVGLDLNAPIGIFKIRIRDKTERTA